MELGDTDIALGPHFERDFFLVDFMVVVVVEGQGGILPET